MDKTLEMSLLFDFFGDLLTDKQKECFDLYHNDDLSLSEIAAISGVSRQGVRDMLVRTEQTLRAYEAKTGVVARYCDLQKRVAALAAQADGLAAAASSAEEKAAAEELAAGLRALSL